MTRATLLALLLAVAAHWTLAAESTTPKEAAKLMLERGWENSAAAKTLVDNEFAAMSAKAPIDAKLLAAHWMALAKQSRYKDSLASLNAFLDSTKDSLPAWQTKVFANAALGNYPDAMQAARELAKALVQKPVKEQTDGLAFLGRFAGFLGGPLEANAEKQKKFEEQILEPFDAAQKQVFEKEKEAVFTKLKEFKDEAAKTAVAGLKAAAEAAEKKREFLEKEKSNLLDAAKKLEEDASRGEEKITMEIDILNQRITGVDKQIIDLQRKKKPFVDDLAKAQPEALRAQREADQQKDPQIRQGLQKKAQALLEVAQGYQIQIDNLENDIARWNRDKKDWDDKIQQAKARRATQQQIVDKKRRKYEQDIRDNEVKLKRLETDKAAGPPKVVPLPAHARYFSSYATLPLDDWRTRLLNNLQ